MSRRIPPFAVLLVCCAGSVSCAAFGGGSAEPEDIPPVQEITLSRTHNGWGEGVAFELTLRADGSARLTEFGDRAGTTDGETPGRSFVGAIEEARFEELVGLLYERGFFEMGGFYDGGMTDQADTKVGVVRGGERRYVVSRGTDGAPDGFQEIVGALHDEKGDTGWKPE